MCDSIACFFISPELRLGNVIKMLIVAVFRMEVNLLKKAQPSVIWWEAFLVQRDFGRILLDVLYLQSLQRVQIQQSQMEEIATH